MAGSDDTVKDAALAVVGVAAAVMGAPGAPIAAAGGVLGIAFERFGSRDTRRAHRIVERLLSADESPQDFAEHLRKRLLADDEDVIGAFRSMLTAALDAVSPAALEAMALLARRHLRGGCPVWVARGGLRALAETTDAELAALRAFLAVVVSYPSRRQALFEAADRGGPMFPLKSVGLYVADRTVWELRVADPKAEIGSAPDHHRRLFRLLKLHGLADEVTDPPQHTRSVDCLAIDLAVAAEMDAALALPVP